MRIVLRAFDLEQAEHHGGVDQRKQVVDLEGEFVGEVGQLGLPPWA